LPETARNVNRWLESPFASHVNLDVGAVPARARHVERLAEPVLTSAFLSLPRSIFLLFCVPLNGTLTGALLRWSARESVATIARR
jgi:hypothetical protein